MKREVTLDALLEACRTACSLRKPAWLAFKQSGAEPKVGAHLLEFSRSSFSRLVKDVAAKDPSGTLALDSWLRALWLDGRVWTPGKSMVVQAGHELKGRR